MTLRALALLVALGVALPAATEAQDSSAATAKGWIGIRYTVSPSAEQGAYEGSAFIFVTDVYRGGPADRGGILPGDQLIAVNGRSLALATEEAWMRALGPLTDSGPGQSLRLTILRGGGEGEVTVVTGQRPESLPPALARDRFVLAQARLSRRIDSISGLEPLSPGYSWSRLVITGNGGRDSLTLTVTLGDTPVVPPEDSTARARAAEPETPTARERMMRAAEEPPAAGGGGTELRRVEAAYPERPMLLTPYILGTPVVLGGALVRDLSPALGRYFGVQSGVLITEVVGRSPAAQARFLPGDVIVSVGGKDLATVMELRDVLAEATLPIELNVIRRGNYLKLIYPNR